MNADEARTVEENRKLVYMVINTLYRQGRIWPWELEDMAQEGMIGLLKAARTYREESGVLFSTFAVKCIQNEIVTKLSFANRERRRQNRAHPSIQMELKLGQGGEAVVLGNILPSKTNVEEEALGMTIENIEEMFRSYGHEEWFEALVRNVEGETLEAIGKAKGVTRQRIGQMVVNARKCIADEVRKREK